MRLWICFLPIERWILARAKKTHEATSKFRWFYMFVRSSFSFSSEHFILSIWWRVCNQGLFAVFVATKRNELLKAIRIGIIFSVVDDFSAANIIPIVQDTFQAAFLYNEIRRFFSLSVALSVSLSLPRFVPFFAR